MKTTNQPRLTPEMVSALGAVPLNGLRNRVRIALAMLELKQVDVVRGTPLTPVQVSDVVRGDYRELSLENSRTIAEFFGCPIEVLFPRAAEVAA